jgi:hypothetical protein
MSIFTPRERAEPGRSAEIRGRGKARELRHDFAPRARPPAEPDISGHVGTLVSRLAASSLQEIDDLILKLQQRREQLINESERVQREIIKYATMSQSTMQSTKIISESLAQFTKVPDAVRPSDPHVRDIPPAAEQSERSAEQHSKRSAEQRKAETKAAAEQRNAADEPPAQRGADEGGSGDKAAAAADAGEPRSDAT